MSSNARFQTSQPPPELTFEEQVRQDVSDICKNQEPPILARWLGPDQLSAAYPDHREIETSLLHLPPERLIFLTANKDAGPFTRFVSIHPHSATLARARVIEFGTTYRQRVRLRLALLRAFREMR